MATQSSLATLENCLPAMDYLLGLFEEAKVKYRDDPFMASRVNSAWSKLDKYYSKTNDSAAYIAALVLDPCVTARTTHYDCSSVYIAVVSCSWC